MKLTRFELLEDYELVRRLFSLGFDRPTPVQEEAVPRLLSGSSVIVSAPTGSGKTCAFAIGVNAAVRRESPTLQALIVSPTRELCEQTADQLKMITGLRVGTCAGSQEVQETRRSLRAGGIQVLVATLSRMKQLRPEILPDKVKIIVVDEADELARKEGLMPFVTELRVGRTFQLAFFSATFADDILEKMQQEFGIEGIIQVQPAQKTKPVLKHFSLGVEPADDLSFLVLQVLDKMAFVQAVVFVNSQSLVDELYGAVKKQGFSAQSLHAGLTVADRLLALKRFASGNARVLITTDLFGRGMDSRSITLVVNAELPRDPKQFVHRSGRAGRMGRQGTVVSFEKVPGTVQKLCREENWEVTEIK